MNLKTALLSLAIIALMIPSTTYAIVDASVYGGLSFSGNLDFPSTSNFSTLTGFKLEDYATQGKQAGAIAHLNASVIPMILSIGIGGFYQRNIMTYTVMHVDSTLTKDSYGLDVIIMSEAPIFIHPYIRGGIAIKEKADYKTPTETISSSKNFNSYYGAIGGAFTIFPFIQLFGEYQYNYSKLETGGTFKTNSINAGVRVNI